VASVTTRTPAGFNVDGAILAKTAINVDVGTVPDAASTAMLLGVGFLGLALLRSRQLRQVFAK
jgi:VPDSG-CTERM motif